MPIESQLTLDYIFDYWKRIGEKYFSQKKKLNA